MDSLWTSISEKIHWFEKWHTLKKVSFHKPVSIQWYLGGKTNISYNCIDRHIEKGKGEDLAIIWEPDNPDEANRKITFKELHSEVCRLANVIKKYGVKKGDRVTIYMPMVPEAAFAMLACARIGAIHSVIFGGFSPDSITNRLEDCDSDFIMTADFGYRGGKKIPLLENVDLAIKKLKNPKQIRHCLVWSKEKIKVQNKDLNWQEECQRVSAYCPPEWMDSEDPSFILYTSGSTGKPKGVLHTTGGYLCYASHTHDFVFGCKPGEIYWCTADVGWITGHSYIVYGPLANGITTLMFEGIPTYPDASRFWQVIDKYKVAVFYTAPTAIRALMREGNEPLQKTSRKSLRLLGSVGEPINPEAWNWYHDEVGQKNCKVVDTWWQTETGGILISPTHQTKSAKPGSAMQPLPGIQPAIVSEKGGEQSGESQGILVLKDSWPGQMRTVYRDHQRFEETYFSTFPGKYFTGDGCKRDAEGDYWITGRIDDVLNVSGHRIGTAEVESALVGHAGVTEAAVVGYPHDIKGQGIYAFVTLKAGLVGDDSIKKELVDFVSKSIGPIAKPDLIQWAPSLPKTRSGKIMRRILRKIAENQLDNLGDTSTLADPAVVQILVDNRLHKG